MQLSTSLRTLLLSFTFLTSMALCAQGSWVPGEILFLLEKDATLASTEERLKAMLPPDITAIRMSALYAGSRYHRLRFSGAHTSEDALAQILARIPGVSSTSLNHRLRHLAQPNDPQYGDQWSMASIGAEALWDVTTGGAMANGMRVAVGIVDELVSTEHPDLVDNISSLSPHIGPGADHGTQVAGVVGAVGDNGIGIAGVNWDVDLLALGGFGDLGGAIEGFEAAIALREAFNASAGVNGALVVAVTASWTLPGIDCGFGNPILEDLAAAGILIITAGDNASVDLDTAPEFPSSCISPGNIVVTSYGPSNEIPFTFGNNTVHLLAPGIDIPTTQPDDTYVLASGNSFAIPHVAGAVALLYANDCAQFASFVLGDPAGAAQQVKEAILNTVTPVPGTAALTITGGRLNVAAAYTFLTSGCPGLCTEVTFSASANGPGITPQYFLVNGSNDVVDTGIGPSFTTCVPEGCYQVFVLDDVGDFTSGTFTVTDASGEVLDAGTYNAFIPYASFGVVAGCTDPGAINFDPNATCDDGSCCFSGATLTLTDSGGDGWGGATYAVMDIHGSILVSGTLEDGSLGTVPFCLENGCHTITVTAGTDPEEIGWSISGSATLSGGADETVAFTAGIVVPGCTDPGASNFDPGANCDDGSCCTLNYVELWVIPEEGTESGTFNYTVEAPGLTTNDEGSIAFDAQVGTFLGRVGLCLPNGCTEVVVTPTDAPLLQAALILDQDPGDPSNVSALIGETMYIGLGPVEPEVCDGIDNDCDGIVDNDFVWYTDGDGDGFGAVGSEVVQCAQPPGTVAVGGDCNDSDPAIFPGANEVCDGQDNDCNGVVDGVDEDFQSGCTDLLACNYDPNAICDDGSCELNNQASGDEVYSPNWSSTGFNAEPVDVYALLAQGKTVILDLFTYWCTPSQLMVTSGFLEAWNDHLGPDGEDLIRMISVEVDGTTNPSLLAPYLAAADWPLVTTDGPSIADLYRDLGLYADAVPTILMICPDRSVTALYPTPNELPFNDLFVYDPERGLEVLGNTCRCHAVPCVTNIGCMDPNACNFDPTATCPSGDCITASIWFADTDGDGRGDGDNFVEACSAPPGFVDNALDCDDDNAAIHLEAEDICDGLDNDCNGVVDDGFAAEMACPPGDVLIATAPDCTAEILYDAPDLLCGNGAIERIAGPENGDTAGEGVYPVTFGLLASPSTQTLFTESFANNAAGWSLDPEWEIESATGSNGCSCGDDPAQDHTPGSNNGVAGMVIGGCVSASVHGFHYLTSPVIDATAALGPVHVEFWRHLHADFVPYMAHVVQVFDGSTWQTIWTNDAEDCVDDVDWTLQLFEVTPFVNPAFRVRFGQAVTDPDAFETGGWSIDDFAVRGSTVQDQLCSFNITVLAPDDNNNSIPDCAESAACTTDLSLDISLPALAIGPTYEVRRVADDVVVATGGGGAMNQGITPLTFCLPDGAFHLVVNGMPAGGTYVLRTAGNPGTRIIDNQSTTTNGQVTEFNVVAPASNGAVQILPGPTEFLYTSCDKYFWKKGEFIVVNEDADVAAEWVPGGGTAGQSSTTGYDFWFYDPNGGYSFIRQRRHNVTDGFGNVGSPRTCHMQVNNWAAANWIPNQVPLNVRVRAVVNNVPKNWGPACRFVRDDALALCPPTKLMDVPGNPFISCNVFRDFNNQSINRLYARPVSGATKYRFTMSSGEGTIVREVTTYYLTLGWGAGVAAPLVQGSTYTVTVEAFKNGAYCQAGEACLVTINNAANGGQQNNVLEGQGNAALKLWPNPNRGDVLNVSLLVPEELNTITMDIFDLSGTRVITRTIAAQDGVVNTGVALDRELAAGMYIVNITAGDRTWSDRIVMQP